MTCIVAHGDGWMVADRRSSFNGGSQIGPFLRTKIRSVNGMLIGTAGAAYCLDVVCKAAENAALHEVNDAISHAIRVECSGEGAILVVHRGCVYEIPSDGTWMRVEQEYWAIGSGYQAALGYLAGFGIVTPETAAAAINFSATLNVDVGDGTQSVRLC
jgi:ATP-dependent protease HslVU (ClpYQ) peptidase subunit